MGANGVPVVLEEEEGFQLDLEEFVLDSGQETGAGAGQQGVDETPERYRHILTAAIRFIFQRAVDLNLFYCIS